MTATNGYSHSPFLPILLSGIDCIIIIVGLMIGEAIRFGDDYDYFLISANTVFKIVVFTVVIQTSFYFFDLYEQSFLRQKKKIALTLLESLGVSFFVLAIVYYSIPTLTIGRGLMALSLIAIFALTFLWRLIFARLFNKVIKERILIVGNGDLSKKIIKEINENGQDSCEIIDLWNTEAKVANPDFSQDFSHINSFCKKKKINRIVVALDERRGKLPLEDLLFCRLKGVRIDEWSTFTENLFGKLSVENLHPSVLIFSDGFKRSLIIRKVKRGVDILCALTCLILLLPLIAVISVAIRLESAGPVFYRQERIGEDGKPFSILKFRSMHVGAEKNGPVWAQANDERITKVGRIIRKLRFDEIPQMINVLRGEMSFVGPRPERPHFVQLLQKEIPFYSQRHTIKPGITGWAQIWHPYGACKEDALQKLKYDIYYLKHMNLLLDFRIMFKTVQVVLFGRGAR